MFTLVCASHFLSGGAPEGWIARDGEQLGRLALQSLDLDPYFLHSKSSDEPWFHLGSFIWPAAAGVTLWGGSLDHIYLRTQLLTITEELKKKTKRCWGRKIRVQFWWEADLILLQNLWNVMKRNLLKKGRIGWIFAPVVAKTVSLATWKGWRALQHAEKLTHIDFWPLPFYITIAKFTLFEVWKQFCYLNHSCCANKCSYWEQFYLKLGRNVVKCSFYSNTCLKIVKSKKIRWKNKWLDLPDPGKLKKKKKKERKCILIIILHVC